MANMIKKKRDTFRLLEKKKGKDAQPAKDKSKIWKVRYRPVWLSNRLKDEMKQILKEQLGGSRDSLTPVVENA